MSAKNLTDINMQRGQSTAFLTVAAVVILIVGVLIGRVFTVNVNKTEVDNPQLEESSKLSNQEIGDKSTETQTVLTVDPVYPKIVNVPVSITAQGAVVASSLATVSAKVTGVALERVLVNEGDWVKKGQALAVFDTKGLEQQIIQANANVVKANTAFESSKSDIKRVKPLLKIGAISVQEYERYVSNSKQAEANLVATNAMLDSQKIRFNDAKVVAPVTGVINKKMATIGAVPQGALFTIIENGQLEWEAEINAQDLSKIKKGTDVVVETFAKQGNNQQSIIGKVIRINPELGNNRQAKIRAALNLPRQQNSVVQAGMLLTGRFILGMKPEQIVPASALVSSDGYNYLMLIDKIKEEKRDSLSVYVGTINKFKVDIGERFNDVVVIKTPLLGSEKSPQALVGQGGSFLNDSDSVRLVGLAKAPATTKSATKEPIINKPIIQPKLDTQDNSLKIKELNSTNGVQKRSDSIATDNAIKALIPDSSLADEE